MVFSGYMPKSGTAGSCGITVFVPISYCLDYCTFVVQFEVGGAWLLQITVVIQGLLCFCANCKHFCSNSVKNVICNLLGIALNLQITLGSIFIFTILILPIQGHGIFLHPFVPSLIYPCFIVF